MSILQGFPLISQQTKITGDGKPSEDASQECVTTCILAAMMYLLGIKAMDAQWNPDAIKDAVYGDGYTGGTAAIRYVDYCKAHGVQLWKFAGMPAILVNEIHKQLAAGLPVLVTVPDIYVPASYGWTHVLVAYADTANEITMLDPWPGKPTTKSNQEWENLLLNNEIWILELEGDLIQPLDISMPAVAKVFRQLDANHWQSLKTGCILQDGFLANYKANGQASLDYLGDVIQNEDYKTVPGKVIQRYEKGVRMDENNAYSSLPLYDGPGVDPLVGKLEAQITVMQSQPAAPQITSIALQAASLLAEATGHKVV